MTERRELIKRRDFIKTSAIGTAGIALGGVGFTAKSYASIIGANERINVGVIGIRNQGTVHVKNFCDLKDSHNVVVKTVCDTDELLFEPAAKIVSQKTGVKPSAEWDLHRVLDDKDIHAVSIAVPNHWHALATVWACQAGKHVYIEKPASHEIWEGRKMVEAARKYNLRVQVGLNNRSSLNVREAIKFLHDGGIGDVYMARALCLKARDSYGMAEDSEPPATFHYDRWLGPAPYRPYNVKRSHYCWHWYWDTGNGDTGNTGPHQLDLARWGMNKREHPVSVYAAGGLYGFHQEAGPKTPGTMVYGGVETYGRDKTTQETPNTLTAAFKYEDGKMIEFECRGRYTNQEGDGVGVGNIFYGTEGWLEISGSTWKAFRGRETKPFAGSKDTRNRDGNHWANFIEAVRSGKNEDLHCHIREGFYSSSLCLLANISYRTGRALKFMGDYEKFANDPEADKMLTRVYRIPYIVPDKV
jgi:predicted dehydrogenase